MLVEDWKQAYKWFSIHIAAIVTVLNALQASLVYLQASLTPVQLALILSPAQLTAANAALGVLLIWGRLIQQGKK